MTVRIRHDIDNTQKLIQIIRDLKRKKLQIGIFGATGSDILMIATVNEFGVEIKVTDKMRGFLGATGLHLKKTTKKIKIPERSYIRGGFDKNLNKISKQVEKDLIKLLNFEMTVEVFYNRLGESLAAIIRRYMTSLKSPKNHSYTLKNKKPKTNPLINTGRLRESVTFKVV